MEDTRHILLIALILNYKMSTHAKRKKKVITQEKITETNKKKT